MNPKSRIKMLHEKCIIEPNGTFMKAVENPMSDEYRLLQELRRDYPEYTVSRRQINWNRSQERYKGLKYEYMAWYINKYEVESKREEALRELEAKIDISRCHSKGKRYPEVRKWFLDKYPNIAEFGLPEFKEDTEPTADAPAPKLVQSESEMPMASGL